MEKPANPRLAYVKIILWFIGIVEVFIFLLAMLLGHLCGYGNSLRAHAVLGTIIGACLLSTLGAMLLVDYGIGFTKKTIRVFRRLRKNRIKNPHRE